MLRRQRQELITRIKQASVKMFQIADFSAVSHWIVNLNLKKLNLVPLMISAAFVLLSSSFRLTSKQNTSLKTLVSA